MKKRSTEDRRCRVCHCTSAFACVTIDGPCHWVSKDLCSRCRTNQRRKSIRSPRAEIEHAVAGLEINEALAYLIAVTARAIHNSTEDRRNCRGLAQEVGKIIVRRAVEVEGKPC